MHTHRFVYSLLLASAAVVGLAPSAYSFTLTDDPSVSAPNTIYYGAKNNYTGQDVIQNTGGPFDIFSAVVSRTDPNTLSITINTHYAGVPGTGPADGTAYGSLFLNPGAWLPTGLSGNNYSTDNFVNGNQFWQYAVTTPSGTPNGPQTAGLGLYATGLNAVPFTITGSDPFGSGVTGQVNNGSVPKYYTTADGKVYMSYVLGNGDPSAGNPNNGTNGLIFRTGQAVQFIPNGDQSSLGNVTETIITGTSITYTIVDDGMLGNTFALAWDMTCANDVIQGQVTLPSTSLNGTPLPAALPLFAGGLGVLGLLGRRRKRKNATAVAAT